MVPYLESTYPAKYKALLDEIKKDWQGLLENSLPLIAGTTSKTLIYQLALTQQGVALCALGRLPEMEHVIQEYIKASQSKREREFWRKKIFQRAGKQVE